MAKKRRFKTSYGYAGSSTPKKKRLSSGGTLPRKKRTNPNATIRGWVKAKAVKIIRNKKGQAVKALIKT